MDQYIREEGTYEGEYELDEEEEEKEYSEKIEIIKNNLLDISEITYEIKDDIKENYYLKMMDALKKLNDNVKLLD